MPRSGPEFALQKSVVDYLSLAMPEPPIGAAWTAVNPDSFKSPATGGKNKMLGARAGWPDLQLVFQGRSINIELKSDKGSLTPAQKVVMAMLTLAGAVVHTVRSVEELDDILRAIGIPLRGRLT